jgi:hypothetical protein
MHQNNELGNILKNDLRDDDDNDTFSTYVNGLSLGADHPLKTDKISHVSIDNTLLDFGSLADIKDDSKKQMSITVYNNTKGKLIVCWNSSN